MNALANHVFFACKFGWLSMLLFNNNSGFRASGFFPYSRLAAFQESEKAKYHRNVHKCKIVRDLENFAISVVDKCGDPGEERHGIEGKLETEKDFKKVVIRLKA